MQRKRAALGDVSNVTKSENGESTKDGKKSAAAAAAKAVGMSTKSTAHSGGIQKISKTNASRTALGSKDQNAKKPAPGIKRTTSQKSGKTDKDAAVDDEPPRKKVDVQKDVAMKSSKPTTEAEKPVARSVLEQREEAFDQEDAVDLDAEDLDDPLMVAEYVVEIFDYLRQLELETMPNPQYIRSQDDLEWRLRGILVDWLVEVHTKFHLLPETLFLTVNIIDRFLSSESVVIDRLQLVGVVAMFIASKYEEVISPHVSNFSHIAADSFSEQEILDAERHVLAVLEYDLSYPNPMNFLRRISKADNYDIETRTIGKYLLEISLLDHRFLEYPQSQVSAAAMYLSRLILGRGSWVGLSLLTSDAIHMANHRHRMQLSRVMRDTRRPRLCLSLS